MDQPTTQVKTAEFHYHHPGRVRLRAIKPNRDQLATIKADPRFRYIKPSSWEEASLLIEFHALPWVTAGRGK